MLLMVTVFSILIMAPFLHGLRSKGLISILLILYSIILAIILSMRDININSDTEVYLYYSNNIRNFLDIFHSYNNDYLFWFLSWFNNYFFSYDYYLVFITTIIVLSMFFSLYYISIKLNIYQYIFIIISVILVMPTFYLQTTNTLRQAVVIAPISLAIFLYCRNKIILSIPLLICAFFIHSQTVIMTGPFFFIYPFIRKVKLTYINSSIIFLGFYLLNFILVGLLSFAGLNTYIDKIIRYQTSWSADNLQYKFIISMTIFYIYIFLEKKYKYLIIQEEIKNIYFLFLCISLSVYSFGEVASRFLAVNMLYEAILIVMIYIMLVNKYKILHPLISIILFLIFLLINYHPSIVFNLNKVSMFYG
ncbi:TPA: EpsG family protein [Photobacterium damselae]